MFVLKINDKEYKVEFGYKPTIKSRIIGELVRKESNARTESENDFDGIEDMLVFLPKLLLIGLQKNHYEEFGYEDYDKEPSEKQLDDMFDLIDCYCSSGEENDAITMFNLLEEELLKNGFLRSVFRQEVAKTEQGQKSQKKKINKN